MTAADVLAALGDLVVPKTAAIPLDVSLAVDSVAYDSRRVVPGAVFVALRGL